MLLRKINDYSVLELLGKGSFGKVYLVESKERRHFALKSIEDVEEILEIVKKQADMYASLNHQNIVKLHEFFAYENGTCLAIVLEYCADGDLSKLIGKIDSEKCRRILKQIAEGLVYLHDQKIIHRDIKPENILMMNGVPKIADFGSSKIMMSSGAKTYAGTQFYLAPEVFNEEKYDDKCDIWSLGIVSLELLVGEKISNLVKGLLAPAIRQGFPSEGLLNQIKDYKLRQLVCMMLKKKSEERYSARQVLDSLGNKEIKRATIQRKGPKFRAKSQQSRENSSKVNLNKQQFKIETKPPQLQNQTISEASSSKVEEKLMSKTMNHQIRPSKSSNYLEAQLFNDQTPHSKSSKQIKQPKQNIKKRKQIHFFSEVDHSKKISIQNDGLKVKYTAKDGFQQLALVKGTAHKKGSSIRLRIDKIGQKYGQIYVGMAIRDIVKQNGYRLNNAISGYELGCFLVGTSGLTYTHTDFQYLSGGGGVRFGFQAKHIIKIETNENELIFTNQTSKEVFKMNIIFREYFKQDSEKQDCFCVMLNKKGDTVSILNSNSQKEESGCQIQ